MNDQPMKKSPMKKILFIVVLSFSSLLYAADNPLGSGDALRITVYGNPDLTTETRVTDSGTINFPLIGEVSVSNKAVPDAEKLIAKHLEDMGFLRQPQVNILVTQFTSLQVSVLGRVARPGKFPVSASAKTVVDFLALAGGIAPDGADSITVMTMKDDTPQRIEIDVDNLFRAGDIIKNLELGAGDIIYVPRAPKFYIYGEVNRSGAYRLERGMTVAHALAVGGGVSLRGTENGLQIKRRTESDQLESIAVEVSTSVQVDDVIYVKESLF